MHKQVQGSSNSPNAGSQAWTFQASPQQPANHPNHQRSRTFHLGYEAQQSQKQHKDPAFYKQLIHSSKSSFLFLAHPDCFISDIVTGKAS